MLCHVMLWYNMLRYAVLWYVMLCYVSLCSIIDLMCYGQHATIFYMCFESLGDCMKEEFGSLTYLPADGTIPRNFAKYFWAEDIIEENWFMLKQLENKFDANPKHILKQLWSKFKARFEELWSNFETFVKQLWSSFGIILKQFRCHVWRNVNKCWSKNKAKCEATLT